MVYNCNLFARVNMVIILEITLPLSIDVLDIISASGILAGVYSGGRNRKDYLQFRGMWGKKLIPPPLD